MMKKLLGMGAIVLLFSVSAYGQNSSKGMIAGSAVPTTNGGGSAGMGGSVGSSGARLPSYPAAHFAVKAVSGGDASYAPSTFLTFQQAVAEGQAESASEKSIAQVAAENNSAPKAKARFSFVQDAHGKVIPIPQQ